MKELDNALVGMDCNAATAIRATAWPEVARSSVLRATSTRLMSDLVPKRFLLKMRSMLERKVNRVMAALKQKAERIQESDLDWSSPKLLEILVSVRKRQHFGKGLRNTSWTPTFMSFGVATTETTPCSSRWDAKYLAAITPNFSCLLNGQRSEGLIVGSQNVGEVSAQKLPSTVAAAVRGASYIKAELLRSSARKGLGEAWSRTWKIDGLFELASKAEGFTSEKLLGGVFYTKSIPPLSANLDATISLYSRHLRSMPVNASERAVRDALISLALGLFPRWSIGPVTSFWIPREAEWVSLGPIKTSDGKVVPDGAFEPLAVATRETLETL